MSQSKSEVLVHIIFSTKNRAPMIDKKWKGHLHKYISKILIDHRSCVHEIGGCNDHIHIACTLPRACPTQEQTFTIKNLERLQMR